MIAHTVENAVAVDSGIVCDGAKASCAAKIALAVDAGLLGLAMYEDGSQFFGGDGIVKWPALAWRRRTRRSSD